MVAKDPKTFFNKNAGGFGLPGDILDPKYNNMGFVEESKGKKAVPEARKKAPNADQPTTASADPSKKLPEVVQKVDPQGAASFLKNMMSMLAMVRNTSNSTSPASTSKTATNALSGALAVLSLQYGFEKVIEVFIKCLANDGYARISENFKETVKEALSDLIQNALQNGIDTLKVFKKPDPLILPANPIVPSPLFLEAPDLYIQQYYSASADPYPGFIQWKGVEGDLIYTPRRDELPFSSADDHIYSMAEDLLVRELTPYILKGIITPEELNTILANSNQQIQNNGLEKSVGKNSSQNILQLASKLLTVLGPIINKAQSGHLPLSVLDQGSMGQSLERFTKNMAIIKKMKDDSAKAFDLPGAAAGLLNGNFNIAGALGGLGNLGSLAGNLGNIAGNLGNIAGIAGNLGNIAGIAGNLSNLGNIGALAQAGSIGNIAIGLGSLGISETGVLNVGNLLNTVTNGQSGALNPELANLAVNVGRQVARL